MTKFNCLVAFTSNIAQYVYCNYMLSICDVINFELIKLFCYITKKSGQKCKDLKNEMSF